MKKNWLNFPTNINEIILIDEPKWSKMYNKWNEIEKNKRHN